MKKNHKNKNIKILITSLMCILNLTYINTQAQEKDKPLNNTSTMSAKNNNKIKEEFSEKGNLKKNKNESTRTLIIQMPKNFEEINKKLNEINDKNIASQKREKDLNKIIGDETSICNKDQCQSKMKHNKLYINKNGRLYKNKQYIFSLEYENHENELYSKIRDAIIKIKFEHLINFIKKNLGNEEYGKEEKKFERMKDRLKKYGGIINPEDKTKYENILNDLIIEKEIIHLIKFDENNKNAIKKRKKNLRKIAKKIEKFSDEKNKAKYKDMIKTIEENINIKQQQLKLPIPEIKIIIENKTLKSLLRNRKLRDKDRALENLDEIAEIIEKYTKKNLNDVFKGFEQKLEREELEKKIPEIKEIKKRIKLSKTPDIDLNELKKIANEIKEMIFIEAEEKNKKIDEMLKKIFTEIEKIKKQIELLKESKKEFEELRKTALKLKEKVMDEMTDEKKNKEIRKIITNAINKTKEIRGQIKSLKATGIDLSKLKNIANKIKEIAPIEAEEKNEEIREIITNANANIEESKKHKKSSKKNIKELQEISETFDNVGLTEGEARNKEISKILEKIDKKIGEFENQIELLKKTKREFKNLKDIAHKIKDEAFEKTEDRSKKLDEILKKASTKITNQNRYKNGYRDELSKIFNGFIKDYNLIEEKIKEKELEEKVPKIKEIKKLLEEGKLNSSEKDLGELIEKLKSYEKIKMPENVVEEYKDTIEKIKDKLTEDYKQIQKKI